MKRLFTAGLVCVFLLPFFAYADTCVFGDTGAINSVPFSVSYSLSATPDYIYTSMKSTDTIGGNSRYIDLLGHWSLAGQAAHSVNCSFGGLTCENPTSTSTAALGFHDSVTGNQRGLYITGVSSTGFSFDGDLPGTGLAQGAQWEACVASTGGGGGSGTTTQVYNLYPNDTNQQEFLFVWGVVLFLAAIPFWERTLSVSRGAYDL